MRFGIELMALDWNPSNNPAPHHSRVTRIKNSATFLRFEQKYARTLVVEADAAMATIHVVTRDIEVLKPNGYELSGPRQRVCLNEGLGSLVRRV
jgi:hypothetical protein